MSTQNTSSAPDTRPITIHTVCRGCGGRIACKLDSEPLHLRCEGCGVETPCFPADRLLRERVVDRCVICGCRELYVRKDFKQKTGVFCVSAAVVMASVVYAFNKNMLWPVLILVASSVIDAVLYQMLPDLTVCYRCKAEYRGMAPNPENKPYSPYTAERYRAQAK